MTPRPAGAQRRVRPAVWAALALTVAAAAALHLWPTPDDVVRSRLRRLLAEDGSGADWSDPRRRRALVELFRSLRRQGDERGLSQLALIAARETAFGGADCALLAEAAAGDAKDWTGEVPAWKRGLYECARGAAGAPRPRVSVTFRFRPSAPLARAPTLAGNWDEGGRVSDLGGWAPRAMRDDGRGGDRAAGDGVWSLTAPLEPTRDRVLYHAVVRTEPWPAGRALGHADFSAASPAVVDVPVREDPAAATAPARPLGPPAGPSRPFRVAVLGVDGATWHVILPLVHRGLLPNFGRMLSEGAVATVAAAGEGYPSLPNIYTAMTGKLGYRHGLGKDYFGLNTGRSSSPLWKIASDGGKRVAAVSMWSSFPPDRVRGDVVTEAFYAVEARRDPHVVRLSLSPAVEAFAKAFGVEAENIRGLMGLLGWLDGAIATTSPDSVAEELRRSVKTPDWSRVTDLFSVTRVLDAQVADTVAFLAGRGSYDLLCAWVSHVDNASHHWGGFEESLGSIADRVRDPKVAAALGGPGEAPERTLAQAYRDADGLVGFLLDTADTVLVFSDHGNGPTPDDFISTALSIPRLLASFRADAGLPEGGPVEFANSGGVWFVQFGAQDQEVARRLEGYLRGALYLPQRQPMFSGVATALSGGRWGVRFVQEQAFPIHINAIEAAGGRRSLADFFDLYMVQATHKQNGILALRGAGVRPGRVGGPVPLTDVAPTVLALLGLPAALDMDGRPVAEALAAPAHPPASPVRTYGSGGNGWLRLAAAVRWTAALKKLASGGPRPAHAAPPQPGR